MERRLSKVRTPNPNTPQPASYREKESMGTSIEEEEPTKRGLVSRQKLSKNPISRNYQKQQSIISNSVSKPTTASTNFQSMDHPRSSQHDKELSKVQQAHYKGKLRELKQLKGQTKQL